MAERAFAALAPDAIRRVRLGGLEAIYHMPSGITHLLAEPVPDLLDALAQQGPGRFMTAQQLLIRIAEDFDIEGDDPRELPERVLEERLTELASLGLVTLQHME